MVEATVGGCGVVMVAVVPLGLVEGGQGFEVVVAATVLVEAGPSSLVAVGELSLKGRVAVGVLALRVKVAGGCGVVAAAVLALKVTEVEGYDEVVAVVLASKVMVAEA